MTASSKVAVETSRAALLESPLPSGTVECSSTSRPWNFSPRGLKTGDDAARVIRPFRLARVCTGWTNQLCGLVELCRSWNMN